MFEGFDSFGGGGFGVFIEVFVFCLRLAFLVYTLACKGLDGLGLGDLGF